MESVWTKGGKRGYTGVRAFGCGEIGGKQVDKLQRKSLRVEISGHISRPGVEIGGLACDLFGASGKRCTFKLMSGGKQ